SAKGLAYTHEPNPTSLYHKRLECSDNVTALLTPSRRRGVPEREARRARRASADAVTRCYAKASVRRFTTLAETPRPSPHLARSRTCGCVKDQLQNGQHWRGRSTLSGV